MRGGAFFNGKEGRDDFRKTAPSRAVTSLALLERARAWEWVKDPLFARGGQGSRNKTYVMNIEEKSRFYTSLQGF